MKMTEEFNLSEKIEDGDAMYNASNTKATCIFTEDVKEFIRLITSEIHNAIDMPHTTESEILALDFVWKLIDKLAGDKFK